MLVVIYELLQEIQAAFRRLYMVPYHITSVQPKNIRG